MNGIPGDFDASVFVGADLIQVAVGRHEVQLVFVSDPWEPDLWIQYASQTAIAGKVFDEPFVSAHELLPLLAKPVEQARVLGSSALVIVIDGTDIEIRDSNSRYESFQISAAGRLVVV